MAPKHCICWLLYGYCLLLFSVHIPCFQYQTILPSLQLAIFSGQLEGLIFWIFDSSRGEGEQGTDCWLVRDEIDEPGVGDLNFVHFTGQEVVLNGLSNFCGVLGPDSVRHWPELLGVVVLLLVWRSCTIQSGTEHILTILR